MKKLLLTGLLLAAGPASAETIRVTCPAAIPFTFVQQDKQ